MKEAKTHAKAFAGHRYDAFAEDVVETHAPLCGARADDPYYSEEPDCKRCQRILRRAS